MLLISSCRLEARVYHSTHTSIVVGCSRHLVFQSTGFRRPQYWQIVTLPECYIQSLKVRELRPRAKVRIDMIRTISVVKEAKTIGHKRRRFNSRYSTRSPTSELRLPSSRLILRVNGSKVCLMIHSCYYDVVCQDRQTCSRLAGAEAQRLTWKFASRL